MNRRSLTTAVLFLICMTSSATADIVMKTVPEVPVWVQGETYTVHVVANSTQHPTDKIASAEWDVNIADASLIPAGADLPDTVNNPSQNPDDFFFGFPMFDNPGGTFNWVDPDFTGGESTGNGRLTADFGLDGPTNVNDKVLGSYHFTVPQGLTGTISFGLNQGEVADSTLNNIWRSPDIAGGTGVVQLFSLSTTQSPSFPKPKPISTQMVTSTTLIMTSLNLALLVPMEPRPLAVMTRT